MSSKPAQDETLYDQITWRLLQLPAEAVHSSLDLKIAEVGSKGPRVLITSGIHGDEGPWGALTLRRLLDAPATSLQGQLRVVFAANPLAAQADARNAPADSLDLNRSFPGELDGSYTERLAAALASLAADCDIVIDLHGGGSWCVNAFAFRFPGSEDLAQAVGAPFVVDAPDKMGTLTQYARAQGARVVAIEMGGRSRDELRWRDRIAAGLMRILNLTGVLKVNHDTQVTSAIEVGPSHVLRPPCGGLFLPTLREEAVGTIVQGGTELGQLLDMRTLEPIHTFNAPYAKTALLLLRPQVCTLEGGAMTYVVAEPKGEEVRI